MFQIENFWDNDDIKILDEKGSFAVLEYQRDLSVNKTSAQVEYFASKMNVKRRQLVCNLDNGSVAIQAGAMQWFVGDVKTTTGIKGVGDFIGKSFRGSVTKESAIKPEYQGTGLLVLEPIYRHILLVDLNTWGGSIVLEDGYFLSCQSQIKQSLQSRSNLSSAALGNEGLFNLMLSGDGVVALESPSPKEELITVELFDDELKVDGSFAIAWSSSLEFSVERSSKSLIGSAASGEGLVNVYRGTGKVLLAPVF